MPLKVYCGSHHNCGGAGLHGLFLSGGASGEVVQSASARPHRGSCSHAALILLLFLREDRSTIPLISKINVLSGY